MSDFEDPGQAGLPPDTEEFVICGIGDNIHDPTLKSRTSQPRPEPARAEPTRPDLEAPIQFAQSDSEEFVICGIGDNIHDPNLKNAVPRGGAMAKGTDPGGRVAKPAPAPASAPAMASFDDVVMPRENLRSFDDMVTPAEQLPSFDDVVMQSERLPTFDDVVLQAAQPAPTPAPAPAPKPAPKAVAPAPAPVSAPEEEEDSGSYIRVNKKKSGVARAPQTFARTVPARAKTAPAPAPAPAPVAAPDADFQERAERFDVNLSVRYSVAGEFVREYAENLSKSGLFVGGAQHLKEGETVDIEIDLPGYQHFVVTAIVVHVRDALKARDSALRAGAGLQIIREPDGFPEALRTYLGRLGARREFLVFVTDPLCRTGLEYAGFQVADVPPVAYLEKAIAQAGQPVVGVVVYDDERIEYVEAAKKAGRHGLVFGVGGIDELLSEMDEAVASHKQSL